MSSDELFLERLLEAVASTRLDAIVVGMTAAALQRVPVMTEDVDLLVRDTPATRRKLERLRAALGNLALLKASELAPVETLIGADVPVDVTYDRLPGGLTFAQVKARSVKVEVGSQTARVASLDDLIRSKQALRRPKDLAHLEILREFLRVTAALERGRRR